MIVSIMQPYFFPYIGYFQLMAASDVFVGFDTAQYIRRGWVNRNRVLDSKGEEVWCTLPVAAADHRLEIRQRQYVLVDGAAKRILRRFENAYRRAPYFHASFPLIQEIMSNSEPNVALFNMELLRSVAGRLGIKRRFLLASELPPTSGQTGEARVIELCKSLGATGYLNPIGGRDLYEAGRFHAHGLSLAFLEPTIESRESKHPYLSILHTLMTESQEAIADLLTRYRFVEGQRADPE